MLRATAVVVVLSLASLGSLASEALAEGSCPNEAFRVEHGMTALPDCRAYEQVSPTEKNGADALGYETNVRAAANGERVTFASYGGFADAVGLKTFEPYFASHSSAGWSSSALYPPQEVSGEPFFNLEPQPLGYDKQLSSAALELVDPAPPGVSGAQPGTENLYTRNLESGAYTLLTSVGVANFSIVAFAAGSEDFSHVLFESGAKLTPEAPIDSPGALAAGAAANLYESVNGQPRLVGILPNGEPAPEGAIAGGGGGALDHYFTENTISTDGSRIFWTDRATGQLYARVDGTSTVHVSASQRSTPDPAGAQPGVFVGATPSGSQVYFTSGEKLTDASSSGFDSNELYAYEMATGRLRDLSVAPSGSAGVLGLLGSADDGSYVYFAAAGDPLVAGAPSEAELAESGGANLYVSHAGVVSYIATVNNAGFNPSEDGNDWTRVGPIATQRQSRVTPSGRDLLFASTRELLDYDNAGHEEYYRYDAVSGQLTCVSCNPTGAPATQSASLGEGAPNGQATIVLAPYLANVLSEDGSRVFFQTSEALLPQDGNDRVDVYEWEAGQLHLISTGQSSSDSYFGDASASGDDVFFVTRQSLVGQDQDQNVDMYDARVEGGIPAQNPATPASPCAGDACHPGGSQAPSASGAASSTFGGNGNLTPPAPPKSTKTTAKSKPLTRAQQLSRALKSCHGKPKKQRASCERTARKRYGPSTRSKRPTKSNAKQSSSSRRAK